MPTDASIELTGRLTVADLSRYQYYHANRRFWPFIVLIGCVAVLTLLALPFILLDDSSDWRSVLTNFVPFFLLISFWLGMLLVLPHWNAKRQYATQSYLREPTTYLFTDEGIELRGESASSTMAWKTIRDVRETRNLFLLYHAPNIAMVIPKHFFPSPGVMDAWRANVTRIMGRPISGTGVVGRWC